MIPNINNMFSVKLLKNGTPVCDTADVSTLQAKRIQWWLPCQTVRDLYNATSASAIEYRSICHNVFAIVLILYM